MRKFSVCRRSAARGGSSRWQILAVLLAVLLAIVAGPASSEGRCPPGSYPVGGQGVGGCAPIGNGQPSSQPRATGRWHKTWGAVAIAPSNGDIGVSTGKASKLEAEQEAISSCRNGGAPDCRSELSYKNQCVAAAKSQGSNGGSLRTGASEEKASEFALARCESRGGSCSIIYVGCSKPVFEYYGVG